MLLISHTRRQKYLSDFLESLTRKWSFQVVALAVINQMATLLLGFLEYLLLPSEKATKRKPSSSCLLPSTW